MRLTSRMKNNKCVFVLETLSESFLLISSWRHCSFNNWKLTNVKGYVLTADPEKYKYFPFWEGNHVITREKSYFEDNSGPEDN